MRLVSSSWLRKQLDAIDIADTTPLIDHIDPDDRARWLASPVAFCEDVLGFTPYDLETRDAQAKILEAVPKHKRIAVRSGHKVGKSRTAASIALWFYTLHAARVVLTAPSARQINEILWREVDLLYRKAPRAIGGTLYETPINGLQGDDGRQIVGFSTDKPERFSGISGKCVVYLVDEASGIDQRIYEAIEGNRAGGAWVILFSNPTQVSGEFFDAFHDKARFYRTFHISSATVANEVNRHGEVPGLASKEWVDEKAEEWGTDSPLYGIRVGGDFPDASTHTVISLAATEYARQEWHRIHPSELHQHPLSIGVDVARFGDDESVIQPRRGRYMYPTIVARDMDSHQLAGKVLEVVRLLLHPGEGKIPGTKKPRVKVDVIGVGAGVYDVLSTFAELDVYAVNVAESADPNTGDLYSNLRTQLWFAVRDFLKDGGTLPPDDKLRSDLLAPQYSFDAQGRYVVEPKKEIKKRIGRSPDRADGFALAIYEPKRIGARGIRITDLS